MAYLSNEEVAVKRLKRLFIKNTGLCELATGSLGYDTCPVLEGQEERLAAMRSFEFKPQ